MSEVGSGKSYSIDYIVIRYQGRSQGATNVPRSAKNEELRHGF
jgi:hypothetical protein